LDAIW
jgi:hypothetical protein